MDLYEWRWALKIRMVIVSGSVLLTACDMCLVHWLMQILTTFFFIFWCPRVSVHVSINLYWYFVSFCILAYQVNDIHAYRCICCASFLTFHILNCYNYGHPTSLAFQLFWLSHYCMYCLFIAIFLVNSFSCLSSVVNKLMKMLLSDPGDQAGIYLKS